MSTKCEWVEDVGCKHCDTYGKSDACSEEAPHSDARMLAEASVSRAEEVKRRMDDAVSPKTCIKFIEWFCRNHFLTFNEQARFNCCIAALRQQDGENARLREAIKHNMRAIDNWLNTYAAELCDTERVKEAVAEIGDGGGTLAYIAALQQSNRNLLRDTEAK